MKSSRRAVAILSTVVALILASPLLRADQAKQSIIARRMEATVCIGTVQNVKFKPSAPSMRTFVPYGTGVLFGIPDDIQKRVCLITANHVFDNPAKKWHPEVVNLRFTWHQRQPLEKYHGLALKIRTGKDKHWIKHPKADLAAIPMFIPTNIVGKSTVSAVTTSELARIEDLAVGQPVMVLGFPGAVGRSLGSSFMTLPLARRGIISWLPTTIDMQRAILVDTMAFPGNSGGPVFNEPQRWDEYGNTIDKPQPSLFIGIVSKAAIQPVELKAVEISGTRTKVLKPFSRDYMGLTQIEPADCVKELLEQVKSKYMKTTEQEGERN